MSLEYWKQYQNMNPQSAGIRFVAVPMVWAGNAITSAVAQSIQSQ